MQLSYTDQFWPAEHAQELARSAQAIGPHGGDYTPKSDSSHLTTILIVLFFIWLVRRIRTV
jgi:hypothetical protein